MANEVEFVDEMCKRQFQLSFRPDWKTYLPPRVSQHAQYSSYDDHEMDIKSAEFKAGYQKFITRSATAEKQRLSVMPPTGGSLIRFYTNDNFSAK